MMGTGRDPSFEAVRRKWNDRTMAGWIARATFALMLAGMVIAPARAGGAEIRVMISGGFSAAYLALVPEFERSTGHRVDTARGASMGTTPSSIPSRLRRGEPVDVFIMVGDALDELTRQGRVAAGARTDLARSGIGVAVRSGSPRPEIGSVDAFRRTMLDARSIEYSTSASGAYLAGELFPRLRSRCATSLGALVGRRSPT